MTWIFSLVLVQPHFKTGSRVFFSPWNPQYPAISVRIRWAPRFPWLVKRWWSRKVRQVTWGQKSWVWSPKSAWALAWNLITYIQESQHPTGFGGTGQTLPPSPLHLIDLGERITHSQFPISKSVKCRAWNSIQEWNDVSFRSTKSLRWTAYFIISNPFRKI